MAYCGKFHDKASYRTYCLMGDGESMEGNIWEALNFAGHYKLNNLCDIIELCKAFAEAESVTDKPTCLIAKTFKSKYFPEIEDLMNWHCKALGAKSDAVIQHVEGLIK